MTSAELIGSGLSTAAPVPSTAWANVARRCARSVALVGTVVQSDIHVITASTVGVVSLDPPLVVVTVNSGGRTRRMLQCSGTFGVSLLSADDEPFATLFAVGGVIGHADLQGDRWWHAPNSGAPVIRSALGWMDCIVERVVEVADRALVIGRVHIAGFDSTSDPLIRFNGEYHRLPAGTPR